MTLPAPVVRSPAVSAALALSLLLLAFLGASGLAVLVLLALDHRERLRRIERKQDTNAAAVAAKLASDRACVLRDVAQGQEKHDSDADST